MSFFLMGEYPSLGNTIALIDNTRIYASKNILFPLFVKVRSCGHAHNPESCPSSRIPLLSS